MGGDERDGSPLFGSVLATQKDGYREKMSHMESAVPENFDYTRSTRENYICNQNCSHVGKYSAIRSRLDTAYHGHYRTSRQALQDRLIDDANHKIKGGRREPWIVFTAGAMGAGKSHAFSWMAGRGHVPLDLMQIIDPDVFKAALPEWQGYLEHSPLDAGYHTRRESGLLTEMALEVALRERKHVWVDGSLRDGEWYAEEFGRLRREHPHYRIAIVHVVADREVVYRRVAERAQVTGRHVPAAEIEDSLQRVPASIELLAPLTDFLAVVDNSAEDVPKFVEYCTAEACHLEQEGCDAWSELTSRLCADEIGDEASGMVSVDRGDDELPCDEVPWARIGRHFDDAGSFCFDDLDAGSFLTQERG